MSWDDDDGLIDVTSSFLGLTQPLSEIIDDIHSRGWTVAKIKIKDNEYVAEGKNPHGEKLEATGRTENTAAGNLLVKIMRREHIRSSSVRVKLGAWDHQPIEAQLQVIAQAYAKANTYDPKAASAWMELAQDFQRRADIIQTQVAWEVTDDPVPYQTADELREDVSKKHHIWVSRAYAHHPIWSEQQMLTYRLVVDVLGHSAAGGDWGWHGACMAFAALAPLLAEEPQKALFTELLGQTAYGAVYRGWGPQKIAFLEDEISKLQEANNSPGHAGVHPSQSIVPGEVPRIAKTAMAESSGDPEIDELIEEFKRLALPGGVPVAVMSDPAQAKGNCDVLAAYFAQFCRSQGVNAGVRMQEGTWDPVDTTDYYRDDATPYVDADTFGYDTTGRYKKHSVAYVEGTGGEVYMVDWTAAQYGESSFPMVQRFEGNNQWSRQWTSSVNQLDPNANWESGITPLPDNAYMWQRANGTDPLDISTHQDQLRQLEPGLSKLHPEMAKQAVVNALRQSVLGSRTNPMGHAVHYQDLMHIPAGVDDPIAYWDALERSRENFNQGQGYAPNSHRQHWAEEKKFEQWVKTMNPHLDDGQVSRLAKRELLHMLTEEEERILSRDEGEQMPAELVEHEAYEALKGRLKALTKPTVDQKVDFGDSSMYHEAGRKRAAYWHITHDPDFQIDPAKGPMDLSSAGDGSREAGALMFTDDPHYWASAFHSHPEELGTEYENDNPRQWAAEIDPRGAFHPVNRGFGSEYYMPDASQARVKRVVPLAQAFAEQDAIDRAYDDQMRHQGATRQWYHGTLADRAQAIRAQGFMPDEHTGDMWFTSSPREAQAYQDRHAMGQPGEVIPANLGYANPFVIDRTTPEPYSTGFSPYLKGLLDTEGIDPDQGDWVDAIRQKGYDAIEYRNPSFTNVQLWDPSLTKLTKTATYHAGMYPPYLASSLRPLAAISRHADTLAQAAQEDLLQHRGRGHHFRAKALQLGIPKIGPRQISHAWLHLAPQTSQLAVVDPVLYDALGHEYDPDARDYFKHEREVAAARDASGYVHVPLGSYSAALWDMAAGGPGWHPDRTAFKSLGPTPVGSIDWNAQTPTHPGINGYWWDSTQQARDQVAQDFDRTVGVNFPSHEVPFRTSGYADNPEWIEEPEPESRNIMKFYPSDKIGCPACNPRGQSRIQYIKDISGCRTCGGQGFIGAPIFKGTDGVAFEKQLRGVPVHDAEGWGPRHEGRTAASSARSPWLTHPATGQRLTGAPGTSLMSHVMTTMGHPDVRSVWAQDYEVGKGLPPSEAGGPGIIARVAAQPQVMYHVAPQRDRDAIQRYGIDHTMGKPQHSPYDYFDDPTADDIATYGYGGPMYPKGNYLWLDWQRARDEAHPNEHDIWVVNHPSLQTQADPWTDGARYATEPINPDYLTLLQAGSAWQNYQPPGTIAKVATVPRYFHSTQAELAPGETVYPASEGYGNGWSDGMPGYDPNYVYIFDQRHLQHPDYDPVYPNSLTNTYEVEPLGSLEQDPEGSELQKRYEARHGHPWTHTYNPGDSTLPVVDGCPECIKDTQQIPEGPEWYHPFNWRVPQARVIGPLDEDDPVFGPAPVPVWQHQQQKEQQSLIAEHGGGRHQQHPDVRCPLCKDSSTIAKVATQPVPPANLRRLDQPEHLAKVATDQWAQWDKNRASYQRPEPDDAFRDAARNTPWGDLSDNVDNQECFFAAEANSMRHPDLKLENGLYLHPDRGPGDHAWNRTPDGSIVDTTAVQHGLGHPVVIPPDHPFHERYVSWADPRFADAARQTPQCQYCGAEKQRGTDHGCAEEREALNSP